MQSVTYRLERQQKDFLKAISNSHINLSFFLFVNETTNTFIHSRSSLENHTRFHTKLKRVKSIPVFRPKRRKNHTIWGGTYLYSLEYPPGEHEYQAFLGKRGRKKQNSSLS